MKDNVLYWDRSRKTPQDYREIARKRGFEWLGPEVTSVDTKTAWQCQGGHIWEARYDTIQRGVGCPLCYGNQTKTKERYQELASKLGIKWIGPEIKNTRTKTGWQCEETHIWEADYHTLDQNFKKFGNKGCPFCANKVPKTEEDYKILAGNKGYEWLGPLPLTVKHLTTWKCRKGHHWGTCYQSIQSGNGCAICSETEGERRVAKVLTSWGIKFERQKRFDLCRNKYPLPFDFYFRFENQAFLIEYQGRQHFEPVDFAGRGEEWARQELAEMKHRDAIKKEFAEKYDFILICIPYSERDNIKKILRDSLSIRY